MLPTLLLFPGLEVSEKLRVKEAQPTFFAHTTSCLRMHVQHVEWSHAADPFDIILDAGIL